MKLAYFDCFSGISGDMVLGAFMDLGVPVEFMEQSLRSLPLNGFKLRAQRAERAHIYGTQAIVEVEHAGHSHRHGRTYSDIRQLIETSNLSEFAKSLALKTFYRLAQVEASIHGCPIEKVHFHELGGVDAIVDVVGMALGLEYLGIENITSSSIALGTGFVHCDHGTLPVPAPATIAILRDIPVHGTNVPHELTTPTGAAIISTIAKFFGPMPNMQPTAVGYGVGGRVIKDRPNLLRVIIGQDQTPYEEDEVTIIETNIDDMNPEIFGFLMDRLFEDGALDVIWIPVHMKKNRPGTMIKVICPDTATETIKRRIFSETTAIGIRQYRVKREKLARSTKEIETSLGKISVKKITALDGSVTLVPEFEVCREIALSRGIALKKVYEIISNEANSAVK